jgi:hypothetical protein
VLQYTIRFQNTGTFPAEFVVIRDTLPLGFDLSTLQMLNASHAYNWRLFENRVLEMRFDHINLPDSTSNEPESHGFVAFSLKAPKGLPLGAQVLNRVGIYFDYNPPVITNYAVFKVTEFVKISEPVGQEWLEFGLSPNPVAAFSPITLQLHDQDPGAVYLTIYNALGRKTQEMNLPGGARTLQLNGLEAGSYFVQVRSGNRSGGKVLVVK